jgi:hypothetical protein
VPGIVASVRQRVAAGVEVVRHVSPRYPPRLIAHPFTVRVAGTIIKFIGAGYLLGRTQEGRCCAHLRLNHFWLKGATNFM